MARVYAFMVLENKLFLSKTTNQKWTYPGGTTDNSPESVMFLMDKLGFQCRVENYLRGLSIDSVSENVNVYLTHAMNENSGVEGKWVGFKEAFELDLEPWVKDTILFFLLSELPSTHYREIHGSIPILLTAPHSKGPHADRNVGLIAERVAYATGAHAIIGNVSREVLDLNRTQSIDHPFRIRIEEVRREVSARYLLDIHGKHEQTPKPDIDLGTLNYRTATNETVLAVKETLEKFGLYAAVDRKYSGAHPGTVIQVHSNLFFPPITEAVQVEIEETFRFASTESFKEIVDALTAAVNRLRSK